MESEAICKAFRFCLRACNVLCSSPYGFDLTSRRGYYRKINRLESLRLYLGSTFVFLFILMSCFNLSAPFLFRVHLLNDLTSVLGNILHIVIAGAFCIPSTQLCRYPVEICGVINYLPPIIAAVNGKTLLIIISDLQLEYVPLM